MIPAVVVAVVAGLAGTAGVAAGWAASLMRHRASLRRHAPTSANRRRRDAELDPLTGLLNRAALLDGIRRQSGPLMVAVVRLEQLDDLRATVGHDHADTLVLQTAARLHMAIGDRGVIGRLDGGDFVVVTPARNHRRDQLENLLRDAVVTPCRLGGEEILPTVSLGVIDVEAGSDPGATLRAATLAAAGENHHETIERLRVSAELRTALARNEFEIYYQPIVALSDGRICGAEALIRWNHPRDGVLTPDRWLSDAERLGLLPEIGLATLDEVCRRVATLNAARHEPLDITVNLATTELRSPGAADAIATIVERSGLAPRCLVVDVDADSLRDGDAAAALGALRRLGIRVSLDDPGLALRAVAVAGPPPVDQLKVPSSVFAHPDDPTTPAIVGAVFDLCRTQGITIAAEAVSAEAQAELLRTAECDRAQGWLYGRPLPYSRFAALLDRSSAGRRAAASGAADEAARPLDRLA